MLLLNDGFIHVPIQTPAAFTFTQHAVSFIFVLLDTHKRPGSAS